MVPRGKSLVSRRRLAKNPELLLEAPSPGRLPMARRSLSLSPPTRTDTNPKWPSRRSSTCCSSWRILYYTLVFLNGSYSYNISLYLNINECNFFFACARERFSIYINKISHYRQISHLFHYKFLFLLTININWKKGKLLSRHAWNSCQYDELLKNTFFFL